MAWEMQQFRKLGKLSAVCGLIVISGLSSPVADASSNPDIAGHHTLSNEVFFNASQLDSSLNIPLNVKTRTVNVPQRQIKARINRSLNDPRVEPMQLTIKGDDEKILSLVEKIARPPERLIVANFLKENYPKGEQIPQTELRLVSLTNSIYEKLNPDSINALFGKKHHEVTIPAGYFKNDLKLRTKFLSQLEPFLGTDELSAVKSKITAGESLRLDRDLLPKFARERVGRHTIFKGPNCFHAALAFQSDALAASSLVNIRQEPGYHRNMVNYDELWRVLKLSFYEIDPEKNPLQYGDMIVFFEIGNQTPGAIDFKSLRHAATYLLGGYVFAKGSKSANSPYVVGTLGEEWETWTKYTNKLGLKVFRRSLKNVTKAPPVDPIDWVY